MSVLDVDGYELKKQLSAAKSKVVVVMYHSMNDCPACKRAYPVMQKMAPKYEKKGVFLAVDCNKHQDVAREANISKVPTFIFYHKGQKLETLEGAQQLESKTSELVEKHGNTWLDSEGHSFGGGGSSGGSGGGGSGSQQRTRPGGRYNPWADPDFVARRLAKGKKSSSEGDNTGKNEGKDKPSKPTPPASRAPVRKPTRPRPQPTPGASTNSKPPATKKPATQPASSFRPREELSKAERMRRKFGRSHDRTAILGDRATSQSSGKSALRKRLEREKAARERAQKRAEERKRREAELLARAQEKKRIQDQKKAQEAADKAVEAGGVYPFDSDLLQQLAELDIQKVRAEKALMATKNGNVSVCLDWLAEHQDDDGIDTPGPGNSEYQAPETKPTDPPAAGTSQTLTDTSGGDGPECVGELVVPENQQAEGEHEAPESKGTEPALAVPSETSEGEPKRSGDEPETAVLVDAPPKPEPDAQPAMPQNEEELQALLADVEPSVRKVMEQLWRKRMKDTAEKKQDKEKESDKTEPEPETDANGKKVQDMSSEEKMAWLEKRRRMVRMKRQAEARQRAKEKEKARIERGKAALHLQEMKKKMDAQALIAERRKATADKRRHKSELREKMRRERERRKKEADERRAELERIRAAKAQGK